MPQSLTVVGSHNAPLTNPNYPRPAGAFAVYWLCAPGVTPVHALPGDIVGNNTEVVNLGAPVVSSTGAEYSHGALTATAAAAAAGPPTPLGAPGNWTIYLDENFAGIKLNTTIWNPYWYQGAGVNKVQTTPANIAVNDGLTLTLSSNTVGAAISSKPNNPSNKGFAIGAESFWEARINYPGNGSNLYNWNAFWVLRDTNLSSGDISIEIDIAETDGWSTPPNASGAHMNFNYIHGAPNAVQQQVFYGTGSSYLGGAWHTYGLHRATSALTAYLDGVVVGTIPTITADAGKPQYCILNAGIGGTEHVPSSFQVSYVRAWAPTGITPNLTY